MSDWKRFWCLLTHRKHWARCNGYATDGLRCLICKEEVDYRHKRRREIRTSRRDNAMSDRDFRIFTGIVLGLALILAAILLVI